MATTPKRKGRPAAGANGNGNGAPPEGAQQVDVGELLAAIGELEMTRRILQGKLAQAEARIAELEQGD